MNNGLQRSLKSSTDPMEMKHIDINDDDHDIIQEEDMNS